MSWDEIDKVSVNPDAAKKQNAAKRSQAAELAKAYNGFYQDNSILKAESAARISLRLSITSSVGKVIQSAMKLLGVEVPQRM